MRYVDIFEVSRSCAFLEGKLTLEDMPELREMLECDAPSAEVLWIAQGRGKRRNLPATDLTVKVDVETSCARCGKSLVIHIEKTVPFLFTKTEEEADAMPIEQDGDDEIVVGKTKFDLVHWVQEELILSLEAFPSHEDCEPEAEKLEAGTDEIPEKTNPFACLAGFKTRKN